MKKLLLVTAIVLFVCSISTRAAGISFGLKGGLAIANASGDFIDAMAEEMEAEVGSKMGFLGGIFADIGLSENFGIQPEILYISKGIKATGEEDEEEFTSTVNLTYLEIPLLLKLKIPASPQLRFQILAGPAIGMNLGAKVAIDVEGEDIPDEDIKDDIKYMDMGVSFGAGVGIGMGSGILTLDGRYTMGLMSIADDEDDAKNNYISIMAGYAFNSGK